MKDTTISSKGWKEGLLRSGIPLEHAVAKVAVQAGMAVESDFSYLRRDLSAAKEWSVDLATSWYCTDKSGKVQFELRCLIECKYRSPNKILLLLPDPNIDFSPVTLGGTISIFDQFYHSHLSSEPVAQFEKKFPFVYKIAEIHDKGAHEQDFRHAIQQLRYGLPALVKQSFDFTIGSHPDDALPTFIAPIIVTNAQIRLLNDNISIEDIIKSKNIEDISHSIRSAIMYSDCGPDYYDHVRYTFSNGSDDRLHAADQVTQRLSAQGKTPDYFSDGSRLVKQLTAGEVYPSRKFASQFFVCNAEKAASLLKDIKKTCNASFRTRSKTSHSMRLLKRVMSAAK